jgi:hypothetical protein
MFNLSGFFTREIRIFLLLVAALALLSVVVTIIVGLAASPKEAPRSGPPILGGPMGESTFSVFDLAVPDETARALALEPALFREPRRMWSSEEVEAYWVDPRDLGIEVLSRENRKKIDAIFEAVP